MKKRIFLFSAILLLIIISIGISIYSVYRSPRIAYVRSQDLVYKYLGMKEAQSIFVNKKQIWKGNIDTLNFNYQKSLGEFNVLISKLSKEERSISQEKLWRQKNELLRYSEATEQKAKLEDEKMTQGVLNQINGFIEEYGKENGYDIILGTTLSGSLLYSKQEMDITEQVLNRLNQSYKKLDK